MILRQIHIWTIKSREGKRSFSRSFNFHQKTSASNRLYIWQSELPIISFFGHVCIRKCPKIWVFGCKHDRKNKIIGIKLWFTNNYRSCLHPIICSCRNSLTLTMPSIVFAHFWSLFFGGVKFLYLILFFYHLLYQIVIQVKDRRSKPQICHKSYQKSKNFFSNTFVVHIKTGDLKKRQTYLNT